MSYAIKFYKTRNNKIPFLEWLDSIKDSQTKRRILLRLNRVSDGNFGDFKVLQANLYELRMNFGSGYRIYYTVEENDIVILFSSGNKSSQEKDIEKALKYLREHKEN